MPSLLLVLQAARPGGAELALLRALPGLVDRGWEITIAAPRDRAGGDVPDAALHRARDAAATTTHLEIGALRRGGGARALRSWPRARRLAARHDLTYLNGTVPARLLPALRGHRTVLHVHDMVQRVPGFWRRAGLVLADSAACAATLGALRERAVLTGCPVEVDPAPAPAPWPADGRPVVAFVGRLEPRKGPGDLVRAAPALRTLLPDVRVALVGGDELGADAGHAAAVLAEAAAAGVEHHPWTADGPALMRHVDVLCVPSRREPFGTVAAEALAAGTPVVAGDVDGLREVVSDGVTGLLIPPGRPDLLAPAVAEAYARRRAMGEAGRHAASRWELPAWTARLDGLLRAELPAAATQSSGSVPVGTGAGRHAEGRAPR